MAGRGRRLGAILIACCALFTGCTQQGTQPASSELPEPIELEVAQPTPTLMPLVPPGGSGAAEADEPDMTFDESGNIWFSNAMKARFGARTFTFAHAPRVLIYHTHAREAFREESANPTPAPESLPLAPATTASAKPGKTLDVKQTPAPNNAASTRSDDPEKTVVHLGALLKQELESRGFVVFHDKTNVEEPTLSTAYERSKTVMEAYDDIDLYIDLHRNAADPVKGQNDVAVIGKKRCARMFFVVGTGMDAPDSEGTANWRENYTFAYSVYEKLLQTDSHLVKENRVKQGYYNQQQGLCLLAEIGQNANLMSDAANTIPLFADALAAVCRWN